MDMLYYKRVDIHLAHKLAAHLKSMLTHYHEAASECFASLGILRRDRLDHQSERGQTPIGGF